MLTFPPWGGRLLRDTRDSQAVGSPSGRRLPQGAGGSSLARKLSSEVDRLVHEASDFGATAAAQEAHQALEQVRSAAGGDPRGGGVNMVRRMRPAWCG